MIGSWFAPVAWQRPPACFRGLPWRGPATGRAASWLLRQGLAPGDRVGLCSANSAVVAELLLAAFGLGIELVLTNHRLPAAERQPLIDRRRPACCLGDRADRGDVLLPERFEDAELDDWPQPGDRSPAWSLASSGSSAAPKTIVLSRAAVAAAASATTARLGLGPGRPWLGCLGFDHIGGAMTVLRVAASGAALCIHPRFAAESVWQDLAGVWGLSLVPTMLYRLLAAREQAWPPGLECLLVGGAALAADLAQACAARGRAPRRTYGLSEAAGMVCCQTAPSLALHCGPPLPGWRLRIVEPDADGWGRILCTGPGCQSAVDDAPMPTTPGWLETGDLGRVDADGNLRVLGRRTDRIICGGENLHPAAIAERLCRHPDIAEAVVVGLPDREWGERPAVCLRAQHVAVEEVELLRLFDELPPLWRPMRWRWMTDWPTNARGKIALEQLRAVLRQEAE